MEHITNSKIIPVMYILNHRTKNYFWVTTNPERTQVSVLKRYKTYNSTELIFDKNKRTVKIIDICRDLKSEDELSFEQFKEKMKEGKSDG